MPTRYRAVVELVSYWDEGPNRHSDMKDILNHVFAYQDGLYPAVVGDVTITEFEESE